MITTGCEGCCFLKQDNKGKGCVLGQMSAVKDGKVYAPGYCRSCRSQKWAKKQNETDIQTLYDNTLKENSLKFDLLIVFDEDYNDVIDLETTLNSDWYIGYARKIIIMDVTGFGNRENFALQYLKSKEHSVPTVVDSSVLYESSDQRDATIRRVSSQVTSPFFMVMPAGKKLIKLNALSNMISLTPSRVIHWSFPFVVGSTIIIPNKLHYGLFITVPYKSLMKLPETESFTKQLEKEETETMMKLSWLCDDHLLI